MAPRLTDQEIDRAVARIRAEYDHYIVHFLKAPDVKRKFEERYAEALKVRMDLTRFLGVEMDVVKSLIQKATDEKHLGPPAKAAAAKPGSYADAVIEKLRARIRDYPDFGLPDHPEKSPDVDKLYGTLRWFRTEIWDVLYPTLLGKSASPQLFQCDTDLGALTLRGDQWPKELEAYWALLNGQADLSQVARAQNRCLLLGAQFFHRARAVFAGAVEAQGLTPLEKDGMARALAFCDRVLADFRLKELASRAV